MKKSEIIKAHKSQIAREMANLYRSVISCDGEIQYQIYIWDDGEIETLEDAQGSTSYLQPKSGESRQLHYIATIAAPCFDIWTVSGTEVPDDEAEREEARQAAIDYLVDEYETNGVFDALDAALDQAEEDEDYDL